MDLFSNNLKKYAPLADRMRPKTLKNFLGQEHILYNNSFLNRAIESNSLGSCIFYGPPGTGKTTLSTIIANTVKADFKKLNAVSSGVGDAKAIISEAKTNLELYGTKTFLLLDECHRWNKAQSDSVLQAIEEGIITFIGSTTENPFINMTRAIVSRCRVFEFKPLTTENIKAGLNRAIKDKINGYGKLNVVISDDAMEHISWFSAGDLRGAYNALELAVATTKPSKSGQINITKEIADLRNPERDQKLQDTLKFPINTSYLQ